MKKLLVMAIAILSVATLISCGASSQTRNGFNNTKSSEQGANTFKALSGIDPANAYIYATPDYSCNAAVTAANINIAGLFSADVAAKTITDFNMALFMDAAYKQALLFIYFEFADSAGQGFRSEIKNASSIVVNGGNIQITFVDGSNVNFTSTPTSSGILASIQDSGIGVPFASGTLFTLIQTPGTK